MTMVAALLLAQSTATMPCPMPVPLPAELSAWTASPRSAGLGTMIKVGKPARLSLTSLGNATLAMTPGKAPKRTTNAGVFGFTIKKPGTYRISLSASAWIDVVAGSSAVTSASHAHGPACSGIAKMVDFSLTPGRYILQLSGAETPNVTAMVSRLS
jgi:hypothetical protein